LECGQKFAGTLTTPATIPAASSPPRTEGTAERRHLTVMFVDLVGSTALSARLDPEDMREIIGAYHRCCAEQITKAGGFVAKYMGDGVLAYFGYPQAHEDDPERAVRGALSLVEAVAGLRAGQEPVLQVRVGIATGVVVVGDLIGEGAAQEQGVVGETPNVAARLQAVAEPGQVVISQSTRRLTGGMFDYCDLGRVALKGLADPVQAWQVTGTSTVQSRFEAQQESTLTPLVGREEELELLLRRWRRAQHGEGQVVLLSGEPGIGKSRLISALQDRIASEPHIRFRYFCSPQHVDSALYPVISHLRRAARFTPGDTSEQRLAKIMSLLAPAAAIAGFQRQDRTERKLATLEALLGATPGQGEQTVALLADLLSVPSGGKYRLSELSAKRRKEKLLDALSASLAAYAAQKPVLWVFEDAHWSDPTSLEGLALAVERVRRMPVLIVITGRPEFVPPWPSHAHVTTLSLARLSQHDASAVVAGVTRKALPREVLEQILTRADGIPLFLEELSKSVLESGGLGEESGRYVLAGALPPRAIPSTLQASLVARIDRLPSARHVAQVAAVIGREFSDELLRAVGGFVEDELQKALNQLVGVELVFKRGTSPNATYTFKHTLVRDAIYGTLLRGQRQHLHARTASALKERFPEVVDEQPELLAQHLSEANSTDEAIACWVKAGRKSCARFALVEAVAQLQKGLALLPLLPEDSVRWRHELELQTALGWSLFPLKGEEAPEAREVLARARALCDRLGDKTMLDTILFMQGAHYIARAEFTTARDIAEELLRLAVERSDAALEILGHLTLGRSLYFLGEFVSAADHIQRVLSAPVPQTPHQSWLYVPVSYSRTIALSYLAFELVVLGHPDQAAAATEEALSIGKTGDPYALAVSLLFAAAVSRYRGAEQAEMKYLEEAISVASEQRFPLPLARAKLFIARILSNKGKAEEGLEVARQSYRDLVATGSSVGQTFFLAALAYCCQKAGQIDEAVELLDTALARASTTNERYWEADLYRARGECLLAHRHRAEPDAEASFGQAINIARRQKAKFWELRASTSLARLWRDQGKRTEARDLLAPIYGWFTEGFDTPDLKEAKALLQQLN
jgi:class 3 adenylate cyclase/tetratricopeptide (TPR) repeat protein